MAMRSCSATPLVLALLLTGCALIDGNDAPQPNDVTPPVQFADFGDDYQVLTTYWDDDATYPRITPDNLLLVSVGYGGGCREHEFTVHSRTANRVYFWLHHDANGDSCEAYLRKVIALPLDDIYVALPKVLIAPNGDEFSIVGAF